MQNLVLHAPFSLTLPWQCTVNAISTFHFIRHCPRASVFNWNRSVSNLLIVGTHIHILGGWEDWLMVQTMRMEQINTLSTVRDGENRVTAELAFLQNYSSARPILPDLALAVHC